MPKNGPTNSSRRANPSVTFKSIRNKKRPKTRTDSYTVKANSVVLIPEQGPDLEEIPRQETVR